MNWNWKLASVLVGLGMVVMGASTWLSTTRSTSPVDGPGGFIDGMVMITISAAVLAIGLYVILRAAGLANSGTPR